MGTRATWEKSGKSSDDTNVTNVTDTNVTDTNVTDTNVTDTNPARSPHERQYSPKIFPWKYFWGILAC